MQGQAQSRKAYERFLADLRGFPWWKDYEEICALWPDWRKAAYIAWASSPVKGRKPETQQELAVAVLGLESDRMIRTWRKRSKAIDDMIAALQAGPLMRHRRDVFDALVASASDPDAKSHQDRKLFLEMTGDYRPKGQPPPEPKPEVTLDEWRKQATKAREQVAETLADFADEDEDKES